MSGNNLDWFDSSDEDEWYWDDPNDYREDKRKGKMKSYYVQFKDDTTHSAQIDAHNEKDAIAQILEDYLEDPATSDVSILSIIEVKEDEDY